MGLLCTGGYLSDATPRLTTTPFTLGMWINADLTAAAQTAWALGTPGFTGNDFYNLKLGSSGVEYQEVVAGGTQGDIFISSTYSGWVFALVRAISTTNRRLDVITPVDGLLSGVDTVSSTPAPASPLMYIAAIPGIGGATPANSLIVAEWWMTNTDIFPGGAATPAALVRELAYRGPFTFPQVTKDLIGYESFRIGVPPGGARAPDAYYPKGPSNWVVTTPANAVMSVHPPFSYRYKRPTEDIAAIAMI